MPIAVFEFDNLLQKIFAKYGEDNFSVMIISDGYKRTFDLIKFALKRGEIKLNRSELKQLYQIERNANKEFEFFSKYSNCTICIGETIGKLFKSIHELVCSDIIITSSGSFARLHKFFKPTDHDSIVINANKYDEQTIENIKTMLAKF